MNEFKLNEQKIDLLEKRVTKLENQRETDKKQVYELDKSLGVFINEMKNISTELKNLVDNFKETIITTENAHEKDIKILKEEISKLDKKVEDLNNKLTEETIQADANKYRNVIKYIATAVIAGVISFIFAYLGMK